MPAHVQQSRSHSPNKTGFQRGGFITLAVGGRREGGGGREGGSAREKKWGGDREEYADESGFLKTHIKARYLAFLAFFDISISLDIRRRCLNSWDNLLEQDPTDQSLSLALEPSSENMR